MKRKLLSLVLGTVMIMATGITSMAADIPMETPAEIATSVMAFDTTDPVAAEEVSMAMEIGEAKYGLCVSNFPEYDETVISDNQNITGYFGVISKDDMEKITSTLNLSDEKANELMENFEKNMKLQNAKNDLFEGIEESTSDSTLQKIYDEADKIDKEMINIFTGNILDKAIELGLLSEETLSTCPAIAIECDAIEVTQK